MYWINRIEDSIYRIAETDTYTQNTMQRKTFEHLASRQPVSRPLITSFYALLKAHCFRQFSSEISLATFLPHLQFQEYQGSSTIFTYGDTIDRYYFLWEGRVFLEHKSNGNNTEKGAVEIVDQMGVIGEYFYDSGHGRRSTKAGTMPSTDATYVLSINKDIFDELYEKQIEQYHSLRNKMSALTCISQDMLEKKGLYKYIEWHQYRFGEQIKIKNPKDERIGVIIEGQCRMRDDNKGSLSLMKGDYLHLEGYFCRKGGSSQKSKYYRSISSQLQIISLPFDFIDKLPQQYKDHLSFIHSCHQYGPSSNLSFLSESFNQSILSSKDDSKKPFILPKVQRETHNQMVDSSLQLIRQFKNRISHKPRKSQSISLQPKDSTKQDVNKFRKYFCLGYSVQKAILSPKKVIKEPKGYFQIPTLKNSKSRDSHDFNKKEWSTYLKIKVKEKEEFEQKLQRKNSNKQNSRQTQMKMRLKTIFDKYNSSDVVSQFKAKKKLDKRIEKCSSRVFQFSKQAKNR